MSDEYDKRLADWMARQGVTRAVIVGTEEHAAAEEMAARAADKKLKGQDYCVHCGKGPQPISGMELITPSDDPYMQYDDDDDDESEGEWDKLPKVEHRVRACPKCWAVHYGDEDELSPEDEASGGPNKKDQT